MGTPVAPPKSTGGGGVVFEDKVCAWFLAHMLVDEPPLEPELGVLDRLHLQTRVDGWLLDDALLTLRRGSAAQRCAFSIKSNAQFTARRAPEDFVVDVWTQFLEVGGPFTATSDFLGLVTTPLPPPVHDAVASLVRKAVDGDPDLLAGRVAEPGWANHIERDLFGSFLCPAPLEAKRATSGLGVARVLARLRFLEFDFDELGSRNEAAAINLCRRALRAGDLDSATKLWTDLVGWVGDLKPSSGLVTKESLVRRVRPSFSLAGYPDHHADWVRLTGLGAAGAAQVNDVIGGQVRLERPGELARLTAAATPGARVILTGTSGSGKSTLARRWFEQISTGGEKCLWFDGQSFERVDYAAFESDLGLTHGLQELARLIPDASATLVLDGLDRLYDVRAYTIVGTVLRALGVAEKSSPWRVVITSQSDESARVEDALRRAGVDVRSWAQIELPLVELGELEPVWQAIPQAGRLRHEAGLAPVLRNLKVLDIIAGRLVAGGDVPTAGWVGESSVAAWFWDAVVSPGDQGQPRSRFLTKLAELQGDEGRASTRTDAFTVPDTIPLASLVRDRVCRVADEQVRFEHDLLGDWARLRILLANKDRLPEYLRGRIDSPLWHRAIRLFGIHLLEHVQDEHAWRRALAAFAEVDPRVEDLLVESAVYAANALSLLDRVKPVLTANRGDLLRRLLARFLVFATMPDPAFFEERGDVHPEVSAHFRYPKWLYWPAVLVFLHRHRNEFVLLAAGDISRVAELWLRYTQPTTKFRVEAAELGLLCGERALAAERDYGFRQEERKLCFQGALAGGAVLADRVAEFCLRAVQRLPVTDDATPTGEGDPGLPEPLAAIRRRPAQAKPWPDGPLRRVSSAFRVVALEPRSLLPLFSARPAVAREVALAALLEEPPRDPWESDRLWSRMRLGFKDHELRWHPPVFVDGPFFGFLAENFAEGLELLARLVDFATERWCSHARQRDGQHPKKDAESSSEDDDLRITIPLVTGSKEFIGAAPVYGWSSGVGVAPAPVAAALMALEQFFYAKQDQKQAISEQLEAVLTRVRSVAFLKVLCDVGRRDPELFCGPLRALLSSPEVYLWDIWVLGHGRLAMGIGLPLRGRVLAELANKFHVMEHRQVDLRLVTTKLVVLRPEIREHFVGVKKLWAARAAAEPTMRDFIEQLDNIATFENYEERDDPKHGRVIVNRREEEREARIGGRLKAEQDALQLVTTPTSCRRRLEKAQPVPEGQLEEFWASLQRLAASVTAGGEASKAEERNGSAFHRAVRAVAAFLRSRRLVSRESRYRKAPESSVGPLPSRQPASSDWENLPDRDANAVAAMIAVLVRLHGDWLKSHPERKAWCVQALERLADAPATSQPWDVAGSISDWTWDCFLADAAADLWVEEPDDPRLRRLVLGALFAPHYVAVALLFRRCFARRQALGENFNRLRRVGFEWASVRDTLDFVRSSQHLPGVTERQIATALRGAERWRKRVVKGFVAGTLPSAVGRWSEMDVAAQFSPAADARYRGWYDLGFDLSLVRAAHEWLPRLVEARDADERREWLEFGREALAFVLEHARRESERKERSFPNNEDENWVLDRAARMMNDMTEPEHPDQFWRSILELPEAAEGWATSFLHAFHVAALERNPVSESYVSNVRAMIAMALGFVRENEKKAWPYYSEVWSALIGIDRFTRHLWAGRHRPIVVALADVFEQWGSFKYAVREHAAELASWLESDAAQPVRVRGLVWLHASSRNANGEWALRDDAGDHIASLLFKVWHGEEVLLRERADSFSAFKALLGGLVAEQNEVALELSGRLGKL